MAILQLNAHRRLCRRLCAVLIEERCLKNDLAADSGVRDGECDTVQKPILLRNREKEICNIVLLECTIQCGIELLLLPFADVKAGILRWHGGRAIGLR